MVATGGLRREAGLEHSCLPSPVRTGWLGGGRRAGWSSAGLRSSSSCRLPAELSFADPRCRLCGCSGRALSPPLGVLGQAPLRVRGDARVREAFPGACWRPRRMSGRRTVWAPEPAPGRPRVSLWVGPQESTAVIGQLAKWGSQIRVSLTDALPSTPAPINRHGGPREHEATPCPLWHRGPR